MLKGTLPIRSAFFTCTKAHSRRAIGIIAGAERTTKNHKSAIAIVPPRQLWPELQEIRFRNDKSFLR